MLAVNETANALADLATENARERDRQMKSAEGQRRWYVWQRLRGTDKTVMDAFDRWGISAYCPRIVELRAVPRRHMSAQQRSSGLSVQRPREVPLFPGYIFTHIDPSRPDWHDACEVAGVAGLVCKNNCPVYMPDEVIASIRKRENNGVIAGKDSVRVVFGVGDEVTVTNGPFASFPGIVEQGLDVAIEKLEPSMRIKVAVNIFGRATPVELDYWQVAKRDQI